MIWDFSSFTNAMWIAIERTTGLLRDPGACLGHQFPGPLDVGGDLFGQLLRRLEPHLVTQPDPELDGDLLTQEGPLEVQQERLDVDGLPPERGVRPHVDRGNVVAPGSTGPPRVYPFPREQEPVIGLEVRRGPSEIGAP